MSFYVDLKGTSALVTGASSGIGAVVAEGLARSGAYVYLAARRKERVQLLAQRIEAEGYQCSTLDLDVSDAESVKDGFAQIDANGHTLGIVVNNAGISKAGSFLELSDNDRDDVIQTNFNGVWNICREASIRMAEHKVAGSIINIASVLGLSAKMNHSAYAASKAAVIHLTNVLSLDLMRYGIRVNSIAPGWFRTEMVGDYFESESGKRYIERMPAKRIGMLAELVGPVLFLASDMSSFVNGITLPVDGALRHQV